MRPMTTVAATITLAIPRATPARTARPSFSTIASPKTAMPQAGSQLAKGIGKVRIIARMRMATPTSLTRPGQKHGEPRPQQTLHMLEKGQRAIYHRNEAFAREGLRS